MELVDVYDNKRQPLNEVQDRVIRVDGKFRNAVHVWIQNENGDFLIQKRSHNKKKFPDYWSIHGGAVDAGETPLQGIIRECKEEIGIDLTYDNLEFMFSFKRTHVFTDVYYAKMNIDLKDIVMQEEEVSDVKWVSQDELLSMIENHEVAPNVSNYFEFFLKVLNNQMG